MIVSFDKKSKEIEICEKTDFTSNAILERKHLEKWIELNPDILGEDLLIITNEYDKFDKTKERLDLLAIDRQGNLVVIELKRDDSGKYVDLQALKYAAYCSTMTLEDLSSIYLKYLNKEISSATPEVSRKKILDFISSVDFEEINDKPRILLVAAEFRQEVTASVMWLRKFGLDIRCIKLTPYKVAGEKIVIEVNTIIPVPETEDYIVKAERKESQEGKISVSRQEYFDFYNDITKKLNQKVSIPLKEPTPQSYYQIATGLSSIHYEWGFHGRPRTSFGVELHMERGDKKYNSQLMRKLSDCHATLEKQTSEKVIYQEDWGQKWSRIYIEYPHAEINDELKQWAVKMMAILINVIQPEIDKIKH